MYKPEEAKLFGAAIKQFLTQRKLSQRQFAKQAGFKDASYISKLVNPKPGKEIAEPRKEIRQQLAKGLGLTEQELLEYIEQYRNSNVENKTLNFSVVELEKAIANPHQKTIKSDPGSIEERIFKATNQLDPERPMFSRMSAIQALGEIVKDYSRYQWNIMEILAAFVRNTPRRKEEEGISDDIQAALTVIGRRDSKKDPENQRLDLSNIDIRGAIPIGANLQRAILSEANLQGTDLREAKLQGAELTKANLQRAKLQGAELEKAKLQVANLEGAVLNGAELQGARLDHANLRSAYLWYVKLQQARLDNTNLEGAILNEAELQGAILDGANLKGALFNRADLEGVSLEVAYLEGADLSEARNLKSGQIEKAFGDSTTVLPDDVERPAHWKHFE